MSLAPENPFPNGVVDCLSVADYIVKSSKSSIHVGGSSAGANLAALVALEIHRKYGPGKIKRCACKIHTCRDRLLTA